MMEEMGQAQMGGQFGQMGQMPMGQMPMGQMPMGQMGQMQMGQMGQMQQMPMGQMQQMPMGQMQQNEVVYPQQGGSIVRGPSTPSFGPVIAVDTDDNAMREDGLGLDFMGGMSRSVRRNPFRMQMGQMGGQMGQMGGQSGAPSGTSSGAPSGQSITVVKLE